MEKENTRINMQIAVDYAERMATYHDIEARELVEHGAKPFQYEKHVIAKRSILEEFVINK